MSRTPPLRLGIGIAVAVLAGLVLVAALGLERYEEQVEVGPSGEARVNGFLGLERSLVALGVDADSAWTLGALPPLDHAVVVLGGTVDARDRMMLDLEPWVAEGGHLVVVGAAATPVLDWLEMLGEDGDDGGPTPSDTGAGAEDALLLAPMMAWLGVDVLRQRLPDDAVVEDVHGQRYPVAPEPGRTLLHAPWRPPSHAWMVVGLEPVSSVMHDGDTGVPLSEEQAADPVPHAAALGFAYGQGWISTMATSEWLHNDALDQQAHASLFWQVLTAPGTPAGATLLVGASHPSLWSLLWTRAWPLLVGALALVLGWSWRVGMRLGPLLPPPAAERRSVLEHTAAAGRFLWGEGHGDALVAAVRRPVVRRLRMRGVPVPAADPDSPSGSLVAEPLPPELLDALAQPRNGPAVPAEDVVTALTGDASDRRSFTRTMQALMRLWRVA